MVQMTNRGRSITDFPREGGDQTGAPAPRSTLSWTGRCLKVDVPPEELTNCIFETQFARFGTYLLAKFY